GKPLDESAAQLGLAKSTLKTRLERGRALLRARLVRRGLGPSGLLLAAAWPAATTRVSAALLHSTAAAALNVAAEQTAPGAISATFAALTEGVLNAMRVTKLRTITAVMATVALAGLGLGWLAYAMPVDPPGPPKAPEPRRVARPPLVEDK